MVVILEVDHGDEFAGGGDRGLPVELMDARMDDSLGEEELVIRFDEVDEDEEIFGTCNEGHSKGVHLEGTKALDAPATIKGVQGVLSVERADEGEDGKERVCSRN